MKFVFFYKNVSIFTFTYYSKTNIDMKQKETNTYKRQPDYKYIRLVLPLDLHQKLIKYQAMKMLHEGKKESLSTCMIELIREATIHIP